MDVSENSGTPKWMVYEGKSYENGWFGGKTHYFRKPLYKWSLLVGTHHFRKPPYNGLFIYPKQPHPGPLFHSGWCAFQTGPPSRTTTTTFTEGLTSVFLRSSKKEVRCGIWRFIHIYVYVIYVYECICVYIYTSIYILQYVYIYTHMYIYVYICIYIDVWVFYLSASYLLFLVPIILWCFSESIAESLEFEMLLITHTQVIYHLSDRSEFAISFAEEVEDKKPRTSSTQPTLQLSITPPPPKHPPDVPSCINRLHAGVQHPRVLWIRWSWPPS